jgi:hypothetical protein
MEPGAPARRPGDPDRTIPSFQERGKCHRYQRESVVLTDIGFTIRIGYDIAWFTSPTRSLGDVQVTAEYIAYNIGQLAKQSATGKVFIIGHSQGNLNIQWAL